MMRVVMGIAGQRQVRRLHVPRDDGRRTGNAGRRVVYRRHGRHVARHRRRAGRRAVSDVLAHAARAHVAAATSAAAAAADVSSGRTRLAAGRRAVTCNIEDCKYLKHDNIIWYTHVTANNNSPNTRPYT